MAARGKKNQPKKGKCWPRGTECAIVFFEESRHRTVSSGKSPGFSAGSAKKDWQSHHLLCICAMGKRSASGDPEKTRELNEALYITQWNINDADNMLGMPLKQRYIKDYGRIEKKPAAAQVAEWAAASPNKSTVPADIPAHNIDHNMYTTEVIGYVTETIWNKFSPQQGDKHQTDATWLATELTNASKEFQRRLLTERSGPARKGGTIAAFKNRHNDKRWADPFSMGETPKERKPGGKIGKALAAIFKRLR